MAILSRLFGGGAATPEVAIRGSALGPNFIEIPSHRFYGQCQSSPNGRFTIAWRDGNDEGTRGGARSEGKGRYLLLDGKVVTADGRLERPNDGKVADNGTFVLNDWRFFTSELRGTFCAFRADGTETAAVKTTTGDKAWQSSERLRRPRTAAGLVRSAP